MIIGFDAAVVGSGLTAVFIYGANCLLKVQYILRHQPINKWEDYDR